MCCGNCSFGENVLAKFEEYPAIKGIINMKLTSFKFIQHPRRSLAHVEHIYNIYKLYINIQSINIQYIYM